MPAPRRTGLLDSILRRGRLRSEMRQAVERAAHLLSLFNGELPGRGFERVGQLPQIDRRRVEICRALASRPRLLLLDEPSAGLNPEETAELMKDLQIVREEMPGLSVIIIEHDMFVIEGVSIDLPRPPQIGARGVAVVPEGRRVFPRMTVDENLRMGAFIEWAPADFAARRDHVFSLFPRLAERRGQTAATMSGGEQAMLAMGRALMSRPRLLLLDEPSLGLAPVPAEQLFPIVQAINRSGTTVFLAEQYARKTLDIAHRGFLVQKGEIVGHGNAEELRNSELVRHAYLRA